MNSKYSDELVKRVQKRNREEVITLKQLAKEEGLTAGQLYYVLYNLDPKATYIEENTHSNKKTLLDKEVQKAIKQLKPIRPEPTIKEAGPVILRPVKQKVEKKRFIPGLSFFDWLLGKKWVYILDKLYLFPPRNRIETPPCS